MAEPYKPFDVAVKELIESDPVAWLHFLGLPGEAAVLMSADLSSLVTDVDRLLQVTNPDSIAHVELQSTYKKDLPRRTLMQNAIVHYRYNLPVHSVILLLRPEADGPAMRVPVEYGKMRFGFDVVRLWEKTAEEVLAAPLALLPLAPLTDISEKEVGNVVKRMEARIDAEVPVGHRRVIWDTTLVLMGLKYKPEFSINLLKGVMEMKESSTYQYILKEGRAEGIALGREEGIALGREEGREEGKAIGEAGEARRLVLLMGGKRFGEPDAATQSVLDAMTEPEAMEKLALRLFEVESWTELFRE